MTNNRINGTVVRFNADRGFAFISTEIGDVFVGKRVAGAKWDLLEERAVVALEYTHSFNERAKGDDDRYRMTATKIFSVEAPAEIEEFKVLTKVAFFDIEKGFGRVIVGDSFSKPTAFLPGKVCRDAGIEPGKGMPVRATVIEDLKGPLVTSFEWGPAIDKEYAEKYAAIDADNQKSGVSGEAPMKHFNSKRWFGHIIVDGADLFFHVNGMKDKGLKERFQNGEIPNGSILGFVVGKYQGNPVALITSVVSLAEVAFEAAEESAAEEAAQVLAEAMAETNVEAVVEAAPAKPKRVRKPKAEAPEAAPATPKAAAKKPKAVKPVVDTPVVVAADLPDGPMADALRGLTLNGTPATMQ